MKTIRFVMERWRTVLLFTVLFAAIAAFIGWHLQGGTKTTVTFEMAPAAYAGITDQILGLERFDTFTEQQIENLTKRTYDPLLDSANQFSMLQFLLQDQDRIDDFLKVEAMGKDPKAVPKLQAEVSAIQDKKGPMRATLSISGEEGDDSEKRALRLLNHVSTLVSINVRKVLQKALNEYVASIDTQIAGIEIAGKDTQSQKIKQLEQALSEFVAQAKPSSQDITITSAIPFSQRELDRSSGKESRVPITLGAIKAELIFTRNITPYSAKLEDLKARRAVALSYAIEKIEIPVHRVIGVKSAPGYTNLPIPLWLAFGGMVGLVIAVTGILALGWIRETTNEFKNSQQVEDERERLSVDDTRKRKGRSEAATNRTSHAHSLRTAFEI